jgi:hypothetical protein
MQRGFWPTAAVRAVTVLALAATASAAFAQAGSVGGTIGNTDKSVSGGNESAPPRRIMPRSNRRPVAAAPQQPDLTAESLGGKWHWIDHCSPAWAGDLEISAASAGQFSGTFLNSLGGKLYDGSLKGSEISFFREFIFGNQHWAGALSRSADALEIRGVVTYGAVSCPFEATKAEAQ